MSGLTEPWDAAREAVSRACREGRCEECDGFGWSISGDRPQPCACEHHQAEISVECREGQHHACSARDPWDPARKCGCPCGHPVGRQHDLDHFPPSEELLGDAIREEGRA